MIHKSVLIIAYFFPPMAGSGVYRTLKFVKYLPQFGWRPIVVCGDQAHPFDYGYDETLLAEVPPEASVLRLPFVSPYGVRTRLKRLFHVGPTVPGPSSPEPDGRRVPPGTGTDREPLREALRRLGRLLHPLEAPPVDGALYWALSIVPCCRRVIETERVDLIYTSSFPYSDHIAGWILKRLTGRPWVADFRDPWTQAWDYRRRGWRRRIDRYAEQRVLGEADRIIGVVPSLTQDMLRLIPGRDPACFVTIENGFDAEDLDHQDAQPHHQDGKTLLAHVGTVWGGTAVPFLEALARLGADGKRLRVRFVGGLAPQEMAWLRDHVPPAEVEILGRVSHAEAIGHMRAADALLLIRGKDPRWANTYSGKVFEYMAVGRPILLAGPEGDASRLLAETGTGVRLPLERPDEAQAMLKLLAEDVDGFRARYYRPNPQTIARYERRALTERLAALFDEVARTRGET